jgi:sulfur relay (sulfurtransferase) complex TusBCD TusD component (DsrE family)
MDARGIKPEALVEGGTRSSMEELTTWTREADRVLVF